MWLNLNIEASHQQNYNIGFSTTHSDVLIHLTQWQYWWWFWFGFLWCFYYLFILKVSRIRTLKMHPKIYSSFRPHSKWGDFLACIIPTGWCINILVNSNLIIRLVEWQNESSLFTIRIRGRQWYWIYKFELKNFSDILSAPKNVGCNKWVISSFNDLQVASDYLQILQLRAHSHWTSNYWQNVLNKFSENQFSLVSSIEQLRSNLSTVILDNSYINTISQLKNMEVLDINPYLFNISRKSPLFNDVWHNANLNNKDSGSLVFKNSTIDNLNEVGQITMKFNMENFFCNLFRSKNINQPVFWTQDSLDSQELIQKSDGVTIPFRLVKNLCEINVDKSESQEFIFDTRFGTGTNNIESKRQIYTKYLTFKQQRIKRKKLTATSTTTGKIDLPNDSLQLIDTISVESIKPLTQYTLLRKNKIRSDNIPVTLAKRILRTKKILVVPAHVNITAITNSYDVVHSWFIPGLGLKFDCVPGRSTHHTFFVDSVGFYYGQCAEICGRYHHHMPIRLCALPFEHFLIWWQSFGASKLLLSPLSKQSASIYLNRKYSW